MEIQGVRVPVVLITLMAALGALFGLQQVYKYSRIDQPLARFFEGHKEVTAVRVQEVGNEFRVRLQLGDVSNLRETYRTLEEGARSILGARPFRLEIADDRDARLVDDYYKLHYVIQEGLATGRFTEMARAVSAAAAGLGLDEARVLVDADRLYVQMRRGSRHLYEIIPRARPAAGAEVLPGGGRP